eukprot:CAMPEP_0119053954 /NCGR_PEP_ID=MMETSP1177-20130426/74755_1 /TAXON_ID=2985 /ORGANISM="Ochromonas sp, Strain CCMP1899" /LENGTH=185 /DNA_ID=CAMNT_0007034045 /DNA_START=163 /DNA_END=720 /DNA_ORIENTATION=-
MTIDQLIIDFMSSSSHLQDEDITRYKDNVKALLENVIIKYDQDIEYQRDLEEQVDNLEVENINQDKCFIKLSRDAKNAIDECKSGADSMAEKMMSTVKLLQIENDFLQDKCTAAVENTEKLKLQRLAELQAMTAVATAFESKLGNLQKKFRVMAKRLDIAEEKTSCDSVLKISTDENDLKSEETN